MNTNIGLYLFLPLSGTLIADFTHISLGPTPAEIQARLRASDDILNAQDDPNLAAKAAMAARVGTSTGGADGGLAGMLSAEEIAMFHAEIDEMARQSQAMALQYGLSAGLCTPEQMMNRENYMLKVRRWGRTGSVLVSIK